MKSYQMVAFSGLRIDSDKVINLCVRAMIQFLNGIGARVKEMALGLGSGGLHIP
jgi:hypothetical protein